MKKIIAGVDEVGRGSLIGPVFAAAVIFKTNIDKKKIKDSKKLSKVKRNILEKYIKKKLHLEYWFSFFKGNRKIKYFKCKFIGHEEIN